MEEITLWNVDLPLPERGERISWAKRLHLAPPEELLESERCEFRLKCGHRCPLPSHTDDVEHTQASSLCTGPCVRSPCGRKDHQCTNSCNQPCGRCQNKETKLLPCGHQQEVKCGEQVLECFERTKKCLPCGHSIIVPCNESIRTVLCQQPCRTELKCGHECTGSCRECYQGHLHTFCRVTCTRRLVCGHEYDQACTEDIPSCPKHCQNRCLHSRCANKCGEECTRCAEPCAWVCEHKSCTRLCYQTCNRDRCNEPCRKKVPAKLIRGQRMFCGHPCIGLCGEKCPTLCRVCDKGKVEEILFGDEDEEATRFVQLRDCGHVFSASGLDGWMDQSSDNSVQLKRCPKCNIEIRQHLRYGNQIKLALADVEKAKAIVRGSADDHQFDLQYIKEVVTATESLDGTGKLRAVLRESKWRELVEHLSQFLTRRSDIKRGDMAAITRKAQFMEKIIEMLEKFQNQTIALGIQISDLAAHPIFKRQLESFFDFLINIGLTYSEQQTEDSEWYITRLNHFTQYLIISASIPRNNNAQRNDQTVDRCKYLLTRQTPYRQAEMDETNQLLNKLQKRANVPGLGITDKERVQIVKAIGLAKGHWYKCPNGHVYVIGDCGGANQEARCPECGTEIGGRDHQLARGNQLAGEMDGARYAAYSDAANLENYDRAELEMIARI